jgi:hypothetical protein
MDDPDADYPEWLINQRGVAYRGSDKIVAGSGPWQNRNRLVRRYARELAAGGRPVTLDVIRDMLRFVDRGYSLSADQISRALAPLYKQGTIAKHANGSTVIIEGRRYRSIRAAAEAEGVSPQTVINRIASDAVAWVGWHHAD